MLFAVKNRLLPTLLVLTILVVAALAAREALGLRWNFDLRTGELLSAVIVLAGSDALLHGIMLLTLGERYRSRYRALVDFFRPQGVREIVAGSLLAGGEEMLFRGVLLEALHAKLDWSPAAALTASAVVFGLLHAIPRRDLLPFTAWAIWEGALLGLVYTLSGSLLVAMVVHVLHDLAGFSLFAWQRK